MAEPVAAAEPTWALDLERLDGVPVLVAGARFAGQAAARALLRRGARVLMADRARPEGLDELVAAGARFVGDPAELPAGVRLVVTSPGLAPDHRLLLDAARRGVPIWGEVEFAWRLRGPQAAPWLMITGTNGKTTTVRMLEAILLAAGMRAAALGNVGVSIIDAIDSGPALDVLAVEVSSFQLHWSQTLRPQAGALLNLAPDHLDWHGSMDAYAAAKEKVWRAECAIGNLDDPIVSARLITAGTAARSGYTLTDPTGPDARSLAGGDVFGVRGGWLVRRTSGGEVIDVLRAEEVHPSGAHNVGNALAAAALATAHGVAPDAIAAGLRSFVPDPHRNQWVLRRGGVDYVDDSKATNPHAARASLSAYRSVVWVAGGQLKGAPVADLVAEVAPRLRAVVLLGVDRAELRTALRRHAPDIPVIDVSSTDDRTMTEVVGAAAGLAHPGDTVLLAPAAASYDMFTGYAARGAAFAAAAGALPAEAR